MPIIYLCMLYNNTALICFYILKKLKGTSLMINIAIVDDENEFSQNLKNSIDEYFQEKEEKVAYHIDTFSSAILFLEKCNIYQIIFMDIDLPIINGLTASKDLRSKNSAAILIYCTNYARFAVDGYQYNASDYLVKPVHKQHLRMTMDKALESLGNLNRSSIAINVDKSMKIVPVDDILYVEVKGKVLIYHLTKDRELLERKSLKEVSEILDKKKFVRCNHCYLVNLDHVSEFGEDNITLSNGAVLAMSRSRKKDFQASINLYLGSQFKS